MTGHGEREWLAVFDAEATVEVAALALGALARLTDGQLRALRWIGLTDEGWTRLYVELGERGIAL